MIDCLLALISFYAIFFVVALIFKLRLLQLLWGFIERVTPVIIKAALVIGVSYSIIYIVSARIANA